MEVAKENDDTVSGNVDTIITNDDNTVAFNGIDAQDLDEGLMGVAMEKHDAVHVSVNDDIVSAGAINIVSFPGAHRGR